MAKDEVIQLAQQLKEQVSPKGNLLNHEGLSIKIGVFPAGGKTINGIMIVSETMEHSGTNIRAFIIELEGPNRVFQSFAGDGKQAKKAGNASFWEINKDNTPVLAMAEEILKKALKEIRFKNVSEEDFPVRQIDFRDLEPTNFEKH